MATRKQRRRRAKEFRHEYVWEDAEGNELESSEAGARRSEPGARASGQRSGREPQPPSWRRTFRRGLIFAPIMFVVFSVISKDLSVSDRVIQTLLIALIFVPFSYFLDGLLWRTYQRRAGRVRQSDGRRGA